MTDNSTNQSYRTLLGSALEVLTLKGAVAVVATVLRKRKSIA
jgi:hypothetical protein